MQIIKILSLENENYIVENGDTTRDKTKALKFEDDDDFEGYMDRHHPNTPYKVVPVEVK